MLSYYSFPSYRERGKLMGGVEDHEHLYSRRSNQQSSRKRTKLKILLLVVSTNLLSVYLFSGATLDVQWAEHAPRIHLWDSDALRRDLNSTRAKLAEAHVELAELRLRCSTAGSLLDTLLSELGRLHGDDPDGLGGGGGGGWWRGGLSGELKLVATPHKLPLGFTPNIGSDELYPVLGSGCRRHQEDLVAYMSYEVGGECPSDEIFAQRLMLKGCEPLPRRRCRPRSPKNYVEPTPFPESMWTIPPDASITWDAYTCKNYSCLANRGRAKGSYDCKDCFDLLHGREKARWLLDNGGLDFGIDDVLRTRRPGAVRIGLDIGGGTGTFAARMRERNVTVVTSTMNFDGPFNSFIASRGLVPMHVSVAHRLPFADHTLDVVHSMHVLSNWIPDVMLEFALYDIYRVLRPGGIFWLDHFFCLGSQLNATYVPMLDRIGFYKLRWAAGRKLDRGIHKDEWYISALLEKPIA